MTNSIVVALGTRPEIIKLAPIIAELGDRARVVHTGQHYDEKLSKVFFDAFGLPEPAYRLAIGGETRATQIGEATSRLGEHLAAEPARAVVVQGDTNTTVGAALAANATGTPLVHIEAGLRSFDRAMPEEHNRIVTDVLSDLLCAPTEVSRKNLLESGIPADRITVTGNTVVEAVETLLPRDRDGFLAKHDVEPAGYLLATFHRPENVDDPATLRVILEELAALPLPTVLPMHPRTRARVESFGLGDQLARLRVVEPVGFQEFLALSAECAAVVSDSGGVQEEVSVLKRPVLVVRRSTERPEVLGTFAERVLPGPDIGRIVGGWIDQLPELHARLAEIPSPYGSGDAAARSVVAIDEMLAG
ncbi:MAG: UDP-N-acetylglucosamine 2-epimerase (non-hydrolyzing) [Acidimicrobiia bacterium]|nr:UDP-N-acetylglucosamine 2-epimerase (non-hydrolyzing) [Acidimicrobiia bacterium]NNF11461.1 UDP-N-acetylglucosamine 2-epimerase (non-hydrolyzing) [Acidimicrobiia bacterium]NNL71313.1 UDP-N-acetylglucosamine 2-epimerase (non-hydrolyzing) [Acidimicrobiia bacterium]